MAEGVPIKVKIGLRPNGHADHPDWTLLPLAGTGSKEAKENAVRAHQIVRWKYDNFSGHDDDTADSPAGMQWGMMIVTQQFADEAVAMFPSLVTVMTKAEAKDFWDNRAHYGVSEFRYDNGQLEAMRAERELRAALNQTTELAALDARIVKALDPDDPTVPGIKRRREVKWDNFTADTKLAIRQRIDGGK